MPSTYLRSSKRLKLIKDGSSIFIYDNGCKNNISLHIKDIVSHTIWAPQDKLKVVKSKHPFYVKYKKKFN